MSSLPPLSVEEERHPGESLSSNELKIRLLGRHLRRQLDRHRQSAASTRPLFVGMQGPQGCGKTTLCDGMQRYLATHPDGAIRCVVLSLDDLYLPFAGLQAVAATNPDNALLAGRGPPGTHDVDLAVDVLSAVREINSDHAAPVHLPIFDKSLNEGRGDRSAETILVEGPVDVFILEGWSVGFGALSQEELARRYKEASIDFTSSLSPFFEGTTPYFLSHSLESLSTLDTNLSMFARAIYPFFDAFVQVLPTSLNHIFAWRLQQEHAMKASNGGRGMTDEQVQSFVRRYLPGYELWGGGVRGEDAPWKGNGLALVFGQERQVDRLEEF